MLHNNCACKFTIRGGVGNFQKSSKVGARTISKMIWALLTEVGLNFRYWVGCFEKAIVDLTHSHKQAIK